MTTIQVIALLPALYWLYWIIAKATLIEDARAVPQREITVREFAEHGWQCCVCRTHWITAALAAAALIAGLDFWTTALLWAATNGTHAYLDDWYTHAEEPGDTGPPETTADYA